MSVSQIRVLLINPGKDFQKELEEFLAQEGILLYTAVGGEEALALIYNDPPDLIVVDVDKEREGSVGTLCGEIKSDNIYGHLPIIALFRREFLSQGRIDQWRVDDFACKPLDFQELLERIRLILSRGEQELDANALTRLPGNNTIIQQIQRRIEAKTSFALAYIDIDNFKAFNDRYGFSRGDEVLRMTARLVGNVVKSKKDSRAFVGQIGGDDFVFLASPENVVPMCEEIIRNFDQIVPIFYDADDRLRGCIDSVNRQGQKMSFPLMTVSIGVALSAQISNLSHFGQISSVATEMKKYAKMYAGSCYRIDQRGRQGFEEGLQADCREDG